MKKLNIILFIILLLSIMSTSAFADAYTDIIDDPQYDGYEADLTEILALLKSNPDEHIALLNPSADSIESILKSEDVDIYPVFYCDVADKTHKELISDFSGNISDEHYWIISNNKYRSAYFSGRNETTFTYDGEKWSCTASGADVKYPDKDGNPIEIDFTPSGIKEFLKKKTDYDDFEEIKLIEMWIDSGGIYVYGKTKSEEYLVPFLFGYGSVLLSVENGEVYTLNEMLDILFANVKENEQNSAESSDGFENTDNVATDTSDVPAKTADETSSLTYLLIVTAVIILILFLTVCCLIIKLRKLQK